VIASDTSAARPKTVTATVPAGSYNWVTTAITGTGNATLTGSYPSRPLNELIDYDANDHAISIDDGTVKAEETLSPSGRVIRRKVSDSTTGAVQEDVIFGYAGPGDTPAYSRPTAGGTVTTYVRGATGLLATYIGTTPTYPITNGHGDIVGTTDAAGAFTAYPLTDEFGVGVAHASRLGWLGDHERFSTGGNLGLTRMGVRLYDPSLGRFLQVDPVEGGSANDYDYSNADPINAVDLDGRAPVLTPRSVTAAWAWDALIGGMFAFETGSAEAAIEGVRRNAPVIKAQNELKKYYASETFTSGSERHSRCGGTLRECYLHTRFQFELAYSLVKKSEQAEFRRMFERCAIPGIPIRSRCA
jgi:RHS repeat-associated protein